MIPANDDHKDVSSSHRQGPGRGAWAERFIVGLLVACMAGTLNLVIVLHRRTTSPVTSDLESIAAETKAPPKAGNSTLPPPSLAEVPRPPEPPKVATPPPPPEDPTKKALAELEGATARELEEVQKADRRAMEMDKARQAAVAVTERWRRRNSLIKSQVATLNEKVQKIEQQVDVIALERDVLARERDQLKAALTKANTGSSFAVLPFKGANGTWQRPIVLECENGSVTLQPRGLNFSMMDLNPHIHPRASIMVQTIARELTVMEAAGSPDGAPVVPYLIFVVRPDGIRAYYEARARLEPLGISFGYELVPQDLKINFPDLADLKTWDGTVPLNVPTHVKGPGSKLASGDTDPTSTIPGGTPGGGGKPGIGGKVSAGDAWASGSRAGGGDSPNDFIWPSRPGGGRSYGQDMGDALDGTQARNARTGRPSNLGTDSGGAGLADSFGDGGDLSRGGAGRDAQGSPTASAAGRGSPGVWATPGDGSTERPGIGGGASGFRSRGTPGRDANGSEFGFDPRGGSSLGSAGRLNGLDDSSAPPPEDIAGLLEKTPSTAATGSGLGRMVHDWTGNGSASGSTGSLGMESMGEGLEGNRSQGGYAGGTGIERNGRSEGGQPSGGVGGDQVRNGGRDESRNSLNSLSGLSSSLLPTNPSDGPGGSSGGTAGATGGANSASESNPRSGSSSSVMGSSNPSQTSSGAPSSGYGFGMMSNPSQSGESSSTSAASGASSGAAGESMDQPPLLPEPERKEPLRIDAAFEIVIACQNGGIEILPGGHRITMKTLQAKGATGKGQPGQELLTRHLRSMERKRAIVDPMIRPRPRIKFVVEPGGDETYLSVRRQLLFSGLEWPMSVQLVEGQGSRFLSREVWR